MDKFTSSPSNHLPEKSGLPIEKTLQEFLHPVTPRREFVAKLQGKLQNDILPIQRKKVVSFYTLGEVFLRTIALFVITVLTVRAMVLIISTWKIIRTSSVR